MHGSKTITRFRFRFRFVFVFVSFSFCKLVSALGKERGGGRRERERERERETRQVNEEITASYSLFFKYLSIYIRGGVFGARVPGIQAGY
jgi:hypothetical protein